MEGNLHGNTSSAARLAFNPQMAAHRLRAFTHIEESEMPGRGRLPRSKTLAVITHGQAQAYSCVPQLDGDLPGTTVCHGVGYSFLPDPEQVHLDWTRKS